MRGCPGTKSQPIFHTPMALGPLGAQFVWRELWRAQQLLMLVRIHQWKQLAWKQQVARLLVRKQVAMTQTRQLLL